MKRKVHIKSTFGALKKLPLEFTFSQVERWISIQKINPPKKNSWTGLFLARYFRKAEN